MRYAARKDTTFWLLAVFAAAYVICNIGTGSLTTWDEAVYANISKNILKTGDWLILHQGPTPWFDKPPLYMWATAVFYNIFGVNEFSTRLTSSLFGIAAVLLTYVFSRRLSDKNSAALAALLLLAMPHYLLYSKMGMMDVTLTFFITLMIYLFWIGQERPLYLFWSGAVLVLAYLTKGLAAFLGPVIIFFYCVFSGNAKLLLDRRFMAGLILSVLIITGWHLTQYLLAGPAAFKNYFGFHIIKRTVTTLEGHVGGPNFYQKVIFNKNKPWSVIIYASFAYLFWQVIRERDRRAILVLSWIACSYILYTVVKTKLNWYIMPIYPALALSAGLFLGRLFKGRLFNYIIILILCGILLQIPLSRAFKLDFTPEVKAFAGRARELWKKGNDIYIIGSGDSEQFYMDFAREIDRDVYKSLIAQKKNGVYCVILPSFLNEMSKEYDFDYEPLYESDRLVFCRLRFRGIN